MTPPPANYFEAVVGSVADFANLRIIKRWLFFQFQGHRSRSHYMHTQWQSELFDVFSQA